jgi:hypothetical protein
MLLSERSERLEDRLQHRQPAGRDDHPPDSVSKWIVITRPAVFSMTVTSGLIGGLLAVGASGSRRSAGRRRPGFSVNYGFLALAVIGLVVAHAANNMINDYFDLEGGIDTDDYVRAQYAPHPILSGWVTKRQLAHGDPDRERDRPRDPAVPREPARAARGRVRARRPVRVGVLRRAADPPKWHGLGEPGCSSSGAR